MSRAGTAPSHLEELFAVCTELLCVVGRDGHLELANPAVDRWLDRTDAETPGRSFLDLVHEEDREIVSECLARVRQDRSKGTFTARFPRPDGASRLVEWTAHPHPEAETLYLIGFDVTESTSTQALHQELSSRHQAILGAIPEIVAEVDTRHVYTWINDAGRAFFGPDVLGREAQEFFCDEDPSAVYDRVSPIFTGSEDTIYLETWQRRADGAKRLLGWWCRALKNESGEVTGVLSAASDITEARRLEANLRDSEQTVQALFDNAAQGILSVDRGRIVTANPMAERLFGYTREELVGQPLEVLLPASLAGAHARHREGYFRAPRARPMGQGLDLMARTKNGTEIPVEISLSHIEADGGPLAVAFVNDISERKKAQAERDRLEHHLEHATKMEAIGRLAGGIAHDFNNLLTALSGFAEITLDELPESHPLYEGAKETFKTCQRSASLVRRLLAVSRRQVLQPQVLDINAKVSELEKMLRSVLREDIELRVRLDPDAGFVEVDESQIEQVVLNLVVNARDAMPKGGRLHIETSRAESDDPFVQQIGAGAAGPAALLSVSDTGCGMDAETLEHVFEPFFTTKPKGKGTGLGLATVYGIVNQSGGHIWADSEPGVGTTFKVYLPRVERRGSEVTAGSAEAVGRKGSETVLVVEDESSVRLVATSTLRKAGYRVLEARDGEEALKVAREQGAGVDLVLTDVVMPRLDGPGLVAELRTLFPDVRVLYMSGHADEALGHHGVLEEGLAFLEKPFTRETLTRRVRERLDPP